MFTAVSPNSIALVASTRIVPELTTRGAATTNCLPFLSTSVPRLSARSASFAKPAAPPPRASATSSAAPHAAPGTARLAGGGTQR